MFQNWLKSIEIDSTCQTTPYCESQIGHSIKQHGKELPLLDEVKIALIGIDHIAMDKVRKYLYTFTDIDVIVADLGNKRNTDSSSLIQVFGELLDNKILPIFVGQDEENIKIFLKTYSTLRDTFNACLVEQKIPHQTQMNNYIEALSFNQFQNLSQLGILGCQAHCTDGKAIKNIKSDRLSYQRLGEIRKSPDIVEPVLRDSDFLCFNMSSVRFSDIPGHRKALPSGFTSEEACQIMRFAGISDRLSSIGIFGYDNRFDTNEQTAKLIAEMVWYFIEAYTDRKMDYPLDKSSMQQFLVDVKNAEVSMSFWKSSKSGRWWLEVPSDYSEAKMISCSYRDYKLACSDEISPNLMALMAKE
jgi:formiminoglutamase